MKRIFAGVSCMVFFMSLQAQTQLGHVKDAITLAEKNNLDYAAAMAQPEIKKADKFLTESAMMPQITGFAAGDYNARLPVQPVPAEIFGGPPGTYKELRFGLPYNLNAGVDVSIPVIKANQWYEQMASKAEWKRAESEAATVAEGIRLRVSQTYFSYLTATRSVELSQNRVNATAEVSRTSTRKWEEGRIGEPEKIRAENLHRSAQMALNNATLEMDNALRNLQQLLNITTITINDNLENYTGETNFVLPFISDRPSFIANAYRISSLTLQSKARLADFFPSLSLAGRYAYYFQSDNPFKSSPGNVTYDQAIIGARINVPIFGGARNYARLKQTKTLLKIGELQSTAEKIRLQKEHADLSAEAATIKQNYRLAVERNVAAQQAESISMRRYAEGIISFTEYAESFFDLIQTEQELLQTSARLAYINYLPTILKSNSSEK